MGCGSQASRLPSKPWKPEQLSIQKGPLSFLEQMQFNCIPFPVIPLLKPKRRGTPAHCSSSPFFPSFCYALGHRMLFSLLTTTDLKPRSRSYCINWILFHIAFRRLCFDTLTFMPNCRLFCRNGIACLCCIFRMNFFFFFFCKTCFLVIKAVGNVCKTMNIELLLLYFNCRL